MKNLKLFLTLFLILSCCETYSQVNQDWVARYNGPGNLGDGAASTAVDNSGNVYVTGYSLGSGTGDDYSTIKYNSSGVQQWAARYNGPGNSTDVAYMVAVDSSGNVFVTGSSRSGSSTNTEDYATIKYNSVGDSLWVRRYNGPGNSSDASYNIAIDNSGNVYVTGSSIGIGSGYDYATIKYNSAGVQQWVSRYNGTGNSTDNSYRIAIDKISGNIFVTGSSTESGTGTDYTTIKYSSSGDTLWVRKANWGVSEAAISIAVDGSGNVYVTGLSYRFSSYAYVTIKYNSSGVEKWVQIYEGNGPDIAYSIAVDISGNVYVTGYSFINGEPGPDFLTIKYDSSANIKWEKRYNGLGNSFDTAYSIAVDNSGNVYVTGTSTGLTTGTDYVTIKYSSSGDSLWVRRYNGPGNGSDVAYSLKLDGTGNVYVTGVSAGSGTGTDYATIKYSQTGSLLTLNLTAFIEGFYNPVSNSMISDTARVYLKNISAPYNTVDSAKGKLSSSGTGAFQFSNALNGVNYYIQVKQRNSIETWSSSVIQFTSGLMTYNFATVSTQAYGSNEIRVDLSPLRFAIYSGDVNQDGTIDLADGSLIDNDSYNFISGYIKTDLTGDNFADIADLSIADNNAFNFVSAMRP